MAALGWSFNDDDRKLVDEFKDFVPQNIYDMHMHVYKKKDLNAPDNRLTKEGPEEAGIIGIKECYARLLEFSELKGGLTFGYPTANCDLDAANVYTAVQISCEPFFRGSMCIVPGDLREKVCSFLDKNPGMISFLLGG